VELLSSVFAGGGICPVARSATEMLAMKIAYFYVSDLVLLKNRAGSKGGRDAQRTITETEDSRLRRLASCILLSTAWE
jgi:hypothetical protein